MRIRTREYLTTAEVEKLMAEAKGGRWGHRDATMILIAYRHGLRATIHAIERGAVPGLLEVGGLRGLGVKPI
jgi:type 1 fimbriae regulatory protein FimB/type 1 fimbriae regulatory protein FimE